LVYQLRKNNLVKKGEFLLKINEYLSQYNDIRIFMMENNKIDVNAINTSYETINKSHNYIQLFETIMHLHEQGIINEYEIKDYYGGRLKDLLDHDIINHCSGNPEFKGACDSLKKFAVYIESRKSRKKWLGLF